MHKRIVIMAQPRTGEGEGGGENKNEKVEREREREKKEKEKKVGRLNDCARSCMDGVSSQIIGMVFESVTGLVGPYGSFYGRLPSASTYISLGGCLSGHDREKIPPGFLDHKGREGSPDH